MRGAILLPIFLNLATPAEAQPRSLGIFFQWGAFEEGNHCFAIAEPERSPRPRDWKPFASIGYWPGHGVRGQLHIRLSRQRSEEHTSELQSLMRISYAVFCLKKKK